MLNANLPTDGNLVCEFDDFLRETRAYVNQLEAALAQKVFFVNHLVDATNPLVVAKEGLPSADLHSVNLEIVLLNIAGEPTFDTILNGLEGQIKLFVALQPAVMATNTEDGGLQLKVDEPLLMHPYDVLALVNLEGDETQSGKWVELFRTFKQEV